MDKISKNYHMVLLSRPGEDKEPTEINFGFEEVPPPENSISPGILCIKNLYLSVDPALRCRMNSDTGVEYLKAWQIGETLTGLGGLGQVVGSGDPNFAAGDLVVSYSEWPWKVYLTLPSSSVQKVATNVSAIPPTLYLSVLGLTGLTAFFGVTEKAHVTRGANQTMVVSGAAGSTGSLAGQIAKVEGVGPLVGICGSDIKCSLLTEELGFDAAINYKTESVAARLKQLCPRGVDIYFDNVGGEISDEVIKQMNPRSHVVLCGQIAMYNKNLPYPPPLSEQISAILKSQDITRERFLVLRYQDKFEWAIRKLADMYQQGQLKAQETVEEGLANAGKAFVSMMTGANLGKQLVKVTEE